jgi:hypothetical protein
MASLAKAPSGHRRRQAQAHPMSLGTILLIVVRLMLVGANPACLCSRSWGYAPTGVLSLVLILLLAMVVTGRLQR